MTILITGKESPVEMEGEIIEPAFLTQHSLSSQSAEESIVEADYLAHQITRNSSDLHSHTQRIFHFIEKKEDKALYSALVDLFLILGDKGLPLRKRMLISAHTLLSDEEFDCLKQSLSCGLSSGANITMPQQKGIQSNSLPFVQKVKSNVNNQLSPIDEARSYVGYGQFDEAITTLKNAILANPRQLALHNDLLEIFQKTAEKEPFISFYEQLLNNKITLPPLWKKTAEEFCYKKA